MKFILRKRNKKKTINCHFSILLMILHFYQQIKKFLNYKFFFYVSKLNLKTKPQINIIGTHQFLWPSKKWIATHLPFWGLNSLIFANWYRKQSNKQCRTDYISYRSKLVRECLRARFNYIFLKSWFIFYLKLIFLYVFKLFWYSDIKIELKKLF